MASEFYFSSDGACRHVGAALINLGETLRENRVVTCTGSKCTWKKKKRTHEEVTPVENMVFTKPTIPLGRKRKVHVNLGQPSLIHGQVTGHKKI